MAVDNNLVTSSKLQELHNSEGPSKFGFLAQALLAVCFSRLGARQIKVKSNGHPDISMLFNGKNWKIETEVMSNNSHSHVLKNEDIEAVKPNAAHEVGYLVLLDLRLPVCWHLIPSYRIPRGDKEYPLLRIKLMEDKVLSSELTTHLHDVVSSYYQTISAQGFSGLGQFIEQESNEILFFSE
ncbi:MAG: hypothetical protein ACRECH_08035 [Nitrososphaerales archaeon]